MRCWRIVTQLVEENQSKENGDKDSTKEKFKNRKSDLTEKWSYIRALKILGQNIEN